MRRREVMAMLSQKEVQELQDLQLEQCHKCKKEPQGDYCPKVWVLGEVKMYTSPFGCKDFSPKK